MIDLTLETLSLIVIPSPSEGFWNHNVTLLSHKLLYKYLTLAIAHMSIQTEY